MRTTEEISSRRIRPGTYGRLMQDILELGLRRGECGVIRGVLPGLADAYEVEFHHPGSNAPLRTLLLARQLEPESPAPPRESDAAEFECN